MAVILNWSPNPLVEGAAAAIGIAFTGLGAGDSHATHEDLSSVLVTQQTEHVHESVGALNLSPNPESTGGDFETASETGTAS